MDITEKDIKERALAMFAAERPNEIWAIVTRPVRLGQDVQAAVSHEVRKQYMERARIQLQAEAENADRT